MEAVLAHDLVAVAQYSPRPSNRIALRTCKYCRKTAYSESELQEFVSASKYRYGRRNTCKDCYALLASPKAFPAVPFSIVGPHCKLPKHIRCERCGAYNTPSNAHKFSSPTAKVCDSCSLMVKSQKASDSKPSSLAVKSFMTQTEWYELARIKEAEATSSPEEFLSALSSQSLPDGPWEEDTQDDHRDALDDSPEPIES